MIKYPHRPVRRKLSVIIRSFGSGKVKGIFSDRIPYREIVSDGDWTPHFGTSIEERQKFGSWDTNDCWEFSPTKQIEMQLNALYKRGEFSPEAVTFFQTNGYMDANGNFNISDQFYDILSGNYGNGGTAEEYFQLIKKYGIIPYNLLHCTDAIAEQYFTQQAFDNYYYGKQNLTQQMYDLGKQSLKYFNLSYQRIGKMWQTPDKTILSGAMKQAPLAYGVPVVVYQWNQINVPACKLAVLNHEVTGYKMTQDTVGYPIIDNYNPFLKVLGDGYALNSVVQGIVTAIPTVASVPVGQVSPWTMVWKSVMEYLASLGLVTQEG